MPVASRQQVLLEILFTLEKAANWCHSVGGSLSLEKRGLDKQEGGWERRESNLSQAAHCIQGCCADRMGREPAPVKPLGRKVGFTPDLRDG